MMTMAAWLRAVVAAELAQVRLHGFFGRALDVRIEPRAHDKDALGDRAREPPVDEIGDLAIGPVEIIIRNFLVAPVDGARGGAAGAEHLTLGHEAGSTRLSSTIEARRARPARLMCGAKRDGALNRPASIAASASVTSRADLPK
jgi:hypothetical protein